MSGDGERGPRIIESHQELVRHIEKTAGRMRVLSAVTVLVASLLAVAYLSQLALPLVGTTTVSVNLADPTNIASEMVVLSLAVIWLYVGVTDLRFAARMRAEIVAARSKEKALEERIAKSD